MFDPFVIPLKSGEKRPAEADWQLNNAKLSDARKRWPGVDRWGVPCGTQNGFWILDIDIKSNGPATIADLERKNGPLPKTRETRTQSGGRHLYFRWNPERYVGCWVGRLPGLDTRGPGGQAVIPPTPGYTWTDESEIADAPQWLYDALQARRDGRDPAAAPTGDRPAGLPVDTEGALRDVRLTASAPEGQRGAAIWALAVRLVRGRGLSPGDAALLIERDYNPRCNPPLDGEELALIDRACTRAETHAQVPYGYKFYHGAVPEVLLRAVRRYGSPGKSGSAVPYRVYPNGSMVQLDTKDGLNNAILDVIRETGTNEPTSEQLARYVTWWRNHQTPEAMFPKPLVINDEPGPSIARLVIEPGETKAWDEFLTRLDAPDMFLAWLWMLTLPVASRQVLWIYGQGADGKTEAASVIAECLGEAASTVDDGFIEASGRWLGSQVYGKRLLLVDDTKMKNVLRRGVVHRITGRSPIKVEFKGVDGFDFRPNCAVLCTSNVEPAIGRGRADRSRLIPIAVVGKGQTADTTWPARLKAEFPALMARAEMAYERLAVKLGQPQIRLEGAAAERLEKAAQFDDAVYLAELEKMGIKLGEGEIKGREFLDRLPYKINTPEWHDLMAWLSDQGVTQRRDAGGHRYWVGVAHV